MFYTLRLITAGGCFLFSRCSVKICVQFFRLILFRKIDMISRPDMV